MNTHVMFTDSCQQEYTSQDILQRLKSVGADDCEILFIHTDILFGRPNAALGKKGYLQELYQILLDLHVPTLIFPAFSYSFPNHEAFDVRNSRTSMGALIEFIRKQPGVCRSLDPLLSMIAVGKRTDLMEGPPGSHCFGPDSGFDRLHHEKNVKFLFFGADFAEYFTYIHYIEKVMEVPYRFDKSFTGEIIDYDGHKFEHTHTIHTQCGGVVLKNFSRLKAELLEAGYLKSVPIGDLEAACIAEADVFREVSARIYANPFTFVHPYTSSDLIHEYTFGKNGERVTHC